jgi:excisionase family DNA binding protein
MTHNGFAHGAPCPTQATGADGDGAHVLEIVTHVTLALSRHVRQLHLEGVPVPREVEGLTAFLVHLARTRHVPTAVAVTDGIEHAAGVRDRMLVTKREAARTLGVSVRTVERLVAAGRLRQVQVERLARFRVRDLESFVHGLADADI